MGGGVPIVLTADRTLMAGYRLLFDGMLAASQTTTSPIPLLAPLLLPRNRGNAPLGLRRVEAALRQGGFGPRELCVATQKTLARVVGQDTRIIGISAGDPGGRGMNSSTMSAVAFGIGWPQSLVGQLADRVAKLKRATGGRLKVVMGGPGSWQVAQDETLARRLGVDHVMTGYVEGNVAAVFRDLQAGKAMPRVIQGQWNPGTVIPEVCGATTMGAVEISRGCGLGCGFCTIAKTPMVHLPIQTIVRDVRTNVQAGHHNIALLSEDIFRYGAQGRQVNPEALIGLLEQVRAIPGVGLIQVDHANVFSAAQLTDDQLRRMRQVLGRDGQRFVWINIGVETPDGDLLQAAGGGAKMWPCEPGDWGAMCRKQLERLADVGFLPLTSLLLCADGQTGAHISKTTQWVKAFDERPVTFFPMLVAPILAHVNDGATPSRQTMRRADWELLRECYRRNFKWLPRMYWDNQTAGGEPLAKRLLLQIMGHGQVVMWKSLFRWHQWRASV